MAFRLPIKTGGTTFEVRELLNVRFTRIDSNGTKNPILISLNPPSLLGIPIISNYSQNNFIDLSNGCNNNAVFASAIQSDGKILLGGSFTSFNSVTRNRLVRLNADGTEDTAFYTNLGTGFNNIVQSLEIQSDGKILVVGAFTQLNSVTRNSLVRLNADGTVDTAFYNNLGTSFNLGLRDIKVQSDGKILLGGSFTSFNSVTRNRLVRLNADGTEDTAFYTNLGTGFNAQVDCLRIQSDGKILAGGLFTLFKGNTRNHLVRLNADGTEDTAFYTNMGTAFSLRVFTLAIQSDGKIIVSGNFTTFNSLGRLRFIRLNADGTEDTAFYTNLGSSFNAPANLNSLIIQSDGKILAGGAFTIFNGNTRNCLVRLNADGTEDTAFYTNLANGFNSQVLDLKIQSDGKILVGGSFTP